MKEINFHSSLNEIFITYMIIIDLDKKSQQDKTITTYFF